MSSSPIPIPPGRPAPERPEPTVNELAIRLRDLPPGPGSCPTTELHKLRDELLEKLKQNTLNDKNDRVNIVSTLDAFRIPSK